MTPEQRLQLKRLVDVETRRRLGVDRTGRQIRGGAHELVGKAGEPSEEDVRWARRALRASEGLKAACEQAFG